ncbi:hypothetical protein [Streptomyces xanthii]|uniref:Alpha-amylase n=1 Tax=Streptomyces xanthii TaxID=2768069 RepID=A0A7H1B107_9ACTN|nr:hypothetical protein [Streptomyces xanthii]QNS02412.1 hypothetical protein IAG42_01480 [Streptomyces xanthii]
MRFRRSSRWVPVTAAAFVAVGLTAAPAAADGAEYARYTLDAAPPASTGTVTTAATGGPQGTFTTNSTRPGVSAGGSAFLGEQTPFGQVYGSSQGMPYLNLATASGRTPSTTSFTFDQVPTPGGWGITLGDIDADDVKISATGPDGQALTARQLGFQESFNYCDASPRPSTCTGGTYTDEPTWDAATQTLHGSGTDTSGASAWLRPTAEIRTLTLTFSVKTGIPAYQVWFAAQTANVSGNVATESGDPLPEGTVLELRRPDGTPVLDDSNEPVSTTPDADGDYTFSDVAAGGYTVHVTPPPGHDVKGSDTEKADAAHGDATGVDFTVAPAEDDCTCEEPGQPGYGS